MRMTHRLLAVLSFVACVAVVGLPWNVVVEAQQAQDQKMETARGELVSVDLDASSFVVNTSAGDQEFKYTAATRIAGAEGAAGLATMSGQQVTVQYTMQGENRVAAAIEIAPRRP